MRGLDTGFWSWSLGVFQAVVVLCVVYAAGRTIFRGIINEWKKIKSLEEQNKRSKL